MTKTSQSSWSGKLGWPGSLQSSCKAVVDNRTAPPGSSRGNPTDHSIFEQTTPIHRPTNFPHTALQTNGKVGRG
eukprot:4087638-Amphidinium_carterae.1